MTKLDSNDEFKIEFTSDEEETEINQAELIKNSLKIKDQENISNLCYKKLRKHFLQFDIVKHNYPTLFAVENYKSHVNNNGIMIYKNKHGYYCNLKQKLTFITGILYNKLNLKMNHNGEKIINWKIAGDGSFLKNFNVLNVNISCIDDDKCKSVFGSYLIGIKSFIFFFSCIN